MSTPARTYVLVHGAFHGGWCWRHVADRLRQAGHQVFTPTCSGHGERLHLLTAQVCLETAVTDVVNCLLFEELKDVILVGHSLGGLVVTMAADWEPEYLRHLVFLDAVVLENGERALDHLPPELATHRQDDARRTSGGLTIPPPPPTAFGVCDATNSAWLRRRLTPQPLAPYTERLQLSAPFGNGIPKTYIACTDPLYAPLALSHQRARQQAGWSYYDLPAAHDAMITAPGAVADLLLRIT